MSTLYATLDSIPAVSIYNKKYLNPNGKVTDTIVDSNVRSFQLEKVAPSMCYCEKNTCKLWPCQKMKVLTPGQLYNLHPGVF